MKTSADSARNSCVQPAPSLQRALSALSLQPVTALHVGTVQEKPSRTARFPRRTTRSRTSIAVDMVPPRKLINC